MCCLPGTLQAIPVFQHVPGPLTSWQQTEAVPNLTEGLSPGSQALLPMREAGLPLGHPLCSQ